MMTRKLITMAALLALAAAPLALAHDGHSNTKDKTVPGPNPHCWPTQNPHDYGVPVSLDYDLVGSGGGAGTASVSDYNTEDCDNHDPTKQDSAHAGDADFDGDFEYGVGGGFFPAGFWADEPICQRGYVAHHDTDVHVHDAIWPYDKDDPEISARHNSVSFTVGADPMPPTFVTTPPVVVDPDGVPDSGDETVISEGGNECITDGCICPNLDNHDWLKNCLHKCPIFPAPADQVDNQLYGEPGSDGGYWVFVNCAVVTDGDISVEPEDKDGDTIPDNANPSVDLPSTVGGICSTTGHIYFPNIWPGK